MRVKRVRAGQGRVMGLVDLNCGRVAEDVGSRRFEPGHR
jgi:hypothetical protein